MVSAIPLPEALRALASRAHLRDTPCGRGTMRWRTWGDGPPLLLLHGGSGSWMHWARNIEALAREHYVLVPDLPGLGQSARPAQPDALSSYADALADGLRIVLGPTPSVDLVAFSFGSIVTGALLANASVSVRNLVLVGPAALGVSKLDGALVGVRHLHGGDRRAANARNLAILMFADPARIDETAIDIQDWNTRHTRTNSPRFARSTTLRDALVAWRKPFAVISGEKDATSQPSLTTPVLRAVCADVEIRALPGIGHWCMYEGSDLFNEALHDVLATFGRGPRA